MVVFEVVLGTVAMLGIVACATVLPAMEIFEARSSRPQREQDRTAPDALPDEVGSRHEAPSVPVK